MLIGSRSPVVYRRLESRKTSSAQRHAFQRHVGPDPDACEVFSLPRYDLARKSALDSCPYNV
jgi:hypothetical protein